MPKSKKLVCPPPCLDTDGAFLSAPSFKIARRVNERLARKMDAAKILDELERGLWDMDEARCSEDYKIYKERKRLYENQEFHFAEDEIYSL